MSLFKAPSEANFFAILGYLGQCGRVPLNFLLYVDPVAVSYEYYRRELLLVYSPTLAIGCLKSSHSSQRLNPDQ